MSARSARPSVLFDHAAAPLGQDASGRFYLVRLADDPSAARLLKRFDHPGWRTPTGRQQLGQQLWRLARLGRKELPGLVVEAPLEGDAPSACVLDAHGARTLADQPPLSLERGTALLGSLLVLLWLGHQNRLVGLRFDPSAVALDDPSTGGGWRWLAPDLVPPSGPLEAAAREDVQALARFARSVVDGFPSPDSPLGQALAVLGSTELGAAAALQAAMERLGMAVPVPSLPAASPLYGCESELETLGAWLRKCAQEKHLHVLRLAGEPGALQWDLCEALAVQVRTSGMRVLVARCQAEHTPELFLSAVIHQLEAMRGKKDGEESLTTPPAYLPPVLARLRLMRELRQLLAEVAAQTPLCVAWLGFDAADGLIQDIVEHLRETAVGLPVLLLLGSEQPDAPGDDDALLMRPLFRPEVERLARAHCPGIGLGPAAIEAAWSYSQGQPARLYRLCLHWLRNQGLRQDPSGDWVPRDDGPRVTPPEDVREFLKAFATLGSVASLATMQALMDMPTGSFLALLESALDAGWLRQEAGWLAFWRADDAEVFRGAPGEDGAPSADELRWHRRLAAVAQLPAATRAYHAAFGGQDAVAVPLAGQAGVHLLAAGALEAAAFQFRLGFEIAAEDDARRLDLLEGLAVTLLEAREPAQALALLVAELGRPSVSGDAAVARLATLQGRARTMLGDMQGARSAYERALPRLSPDATASRVRVMVALADFAYDRGERERGQALAGDALRLAREAGSQVLLAEAQTCLGRGLLLGPRTHWAEGLSTLLEASALALSAGQLEAAATAQRLATEARRDLELLADARTSNEEYRSLLVALGRGDDATGAALQAAWIASQLGLFEVALAELDAHDFEGAQTQRPERWVQATAIRAVASLHLGYLHDPLRLLDQALRSARSLSDEALELAVTRQQVAALLFLGKHGRAEEVCQTGLGLAAALGDRAAELWLRADLAEIGMQQGDPERAQRLYQRVRDEASDVGLPASQARALLGLARLAHDRGAPLEARALTEEARGLAGRAGHVVLATEIELLEGEVALAQNAPSQAYERFEAANALIDQLGSPHYRAMALFGLGQSVGDPQRASGFLARAADQMNVYLEQLSLNGRKDFLARTERRRVVDVREAELSAGQSKATVTSLPGTRSAIFELLKQGQGSSWGGWQDSIALLDEIFGLVTARLPLEELIVRMNETFIRISQASRGAVYLVNEDDELRLRNMQTMPESVAGLGATDPLASVLTRVRVSGKTLWVPNTLEDSSYAGLPEVTDFGLRGLLCIPLEVRRADGSGSRVLGCLYGDRQAPWVGVGDKEVGLLELMARYIAVTLEIGVLQDESERKTRRLEMLNDLSRAMAGTLDLERLLNLALMQIMKVSAGQQGYLFFGEELKCRASLDQDGKVLTEIQVSRSVIERVARDRKPLAILDVGADEELQQKASLMFRNVRSVMCVPLLLDDRLVGLIYISSSTANKTFTRNDLDLMTAIASQVGLALQNAQAYEIIKDLNTGLEAKVGARTAELEEAYRELQEAQAQLLETEKLATIGTLAGGVAHEINNPLGAVLTNAQLLMIELEDPDQLDSLRMIEEGARRCKEIVAALLKYSRPPQASHRPVEMRTVVSETLHMLERQLQQDGIRVETTLEAEPTVMGDATELRQVVTHLLLNAIDAIRDVGRPGFGRITVRLSRGLDGVKLTVADNGAGMPPDVVKRIFDPFYTTKKVGSGTGLGLSVCQRVIDKHGGKLQVSSTPGAGSTFTIALPAA